ncbi:unannotated protein [freshwater metagenome]|uniref:Unannotated protein n=1 Tax=freshwater metagenome TaxID=449393 RepID=A0A6J7D5L6_9ZZZZ
MSLVEEDSGDDALDRLIDRGIIKDNVCTLAAEFKGDAGVGSGQSSRNVPTNSGRTRERNLVDSGVFDQCLTGNTTVPRDDVDDSFGKPGLFANVGEHERR